MDPVTVYIRIGATEVRGAELSFTVQKSDLIRYLADAAQLLSSTINKQIQERDDAVNR